MSALGALIDFTESLREAGESLNLIDFSEPKMY